MTELVKVRYDNQKPSVFGRDLHEALGIKTAYKDWFPRMCEYGFEEGRDFNLLKFERVQIEGSREVSREVVDHQLTIEMAKEICMIQRTEIGKRCREYFLEIERRYNEHVKALTPEECSLEQARIMLEHNKRLSAVENKVSQLEARIETQPEHCYTVAGYASLRGINIDVNRANMLGRKAAKLSREYGYDVSKTQDPRFGSVNIYHEDILKSVFAEHIKTCRSSSDG